MKKITLTEEIVEKYMPFVKRIATQIKIFYFNDSDIDDLMNFGLLGLMNAIKKYNIDKKVPFELYASLKIRESIIDGVRKYVKMNPDDIKLIIEMNILKEEYSNHLTLEQLGHLLEISVDRVKELEEYGNFSYTVSIENIERKYLNYNLSLENVELYGLREELLKIYFELSKQQQRFVYLYYVRQFDISEIAKILGISSSYVSQIKSKTLQKLRKEENWNRLKDY